MTSYLFFDIKFLDCRIYKVKVIQNVKLINKFNIFILINDILQKKKHKCGEKNYVWKFSELS